MLIGAPGEDGDVWSGNFFEDGSSDTLLTGEREREIFINNLLVRVHFVTEIILLDRPCAMGV